ncbi:MAG: lipoate--protein ligase [Bacteroidales bacterium]
MRIIHRPQTNPYFNIAAEEYVLKNMDEDCFMLWRNQASVIVGKHQNTLAEINLDYVQQHQIPVIRRLSGGGAVFHDLGNICFTFVQNIESEKIPDFKKFTQPILSLLQSMGVNAVFEGRNDLTIEGKKFSGNADCLYKNRVLHHGTLLFSSEIEDMSQCLQNNAIKFDDKAVKSVRSRITNISEHLKSKMSVEEFIFTLEKYMVNLYPQAQLAELTSTQIETIHQLVTQKYSTWEWNFGKSPKYNFSKNMRTQKGGTLEVCLEVHNGRMEEVHIFGDYFFKADTADIENALRGQLHKEENVKLILRSFDLSRYFTHIDETEIMSLLF